MENTFIWFKKAVFEKTFALPFRTAHFRIKLCCISSATSEVHHGCATRIQRNKKILNIVKLALGSSLNRALEKGCDDLSLEEDEDDEGGYQD